MKTGYLYFLGSKSQNAVKVGFAVSLYSRYASLQSGNPGELKEWGVVPIEADAELALHRYLRPMRIAREWYPDGGSLMFAILCHLTEAWGDKVQDTSDGDWAETGDEYINPAEVYLTAKEVLSAAREMVEDFEANPDGDEDDIYPPPYDGGGQPLPPA